MLNIDLRTIPDHCVDQYRRDTKKEPEDDLNDYLIYWNIQMNIKNQMKIGSLNDQLDKLTKEFNKLYAVVEKHKEMLNG